MRKNRPEMMCERPTRNTLTYGHVFNLGLPVVLNSYLITGNVDNIHLRPKT